MNDQQRAFLEDTRRRLRINRHRLDDELEVQAEMQEEIARQRGDLEQRMLSAKEDLARTEARLIEEFRGEKSTKDLAEAQARRHPERSRAHDRFMAAQRDFREFDDLLDAWKARVKDIHELGRLFAAQYWTKNSIRGSDDRPASERYERPNTRRRERAE